MKKLALLLLLASTAARADGGLWLDTYGGTPLDEELQLSLRETSLSGPTLEASGRFDPQSDPLLGLRLRGVTDQLPFGVGIDVGYLKTRSAEADLHLVPIALGITLPAHLTPRAAWQNVHPIGMLGVVATSVEGSASIGAISGEIANNTFASPRGRAGLHLSGGLQWEVRPGLALFAEYRYQQLRFRLENTNDILFATRRINTSGRLESSALLFGISWRLTTHRSAPAAAQ